MLCIPIILLPKPIIKIFQNEKQKKICEFNINLENNINNEMPLVNNQEIGKKEEEIEPLLNNDDLKYAEIQYDSEKSDFLDKNLLQKPKKD